MLYDGDDVVDGAGEMVRSTSTGDSTSAVSLDLLGLSCLIISGVSKVFFLEGGVSSGFFLFLAGCIPLGEIGGRGY